MGKAWIFGFAAVGLIGFFSTSSPSYAWDSAQGVRESIVQGVRDDVRRQIQLREQRIRNSHAELRSNLIVPTRKARIRKTL